MHFKDWEELSKLCPLESGIWNKEKLYEYLVQSCYHLSDHIDAFMEKYQKDEALAGLLFDFLLDDYYDGSDSQMGAAKYIARLDRELLKKNRESLLRAQENEAAWKRPFHNGEDWRSFIDSDSEY
ncbi:MAG: hypothetical protein K2O34_01800 [Acetatifactor sp.]|nr:hypothetical protein [Acetatifactor sp.]